MSKATIKKGMEQLRKRIMDSPRVWKFRGRRVVPADKWEPGDWTTLPDRYHIAVDLWLHPPADWWNDYKALMTKLEDPLAGKRLCYDCAIYHAQEAKKEIERFSWADRGGKQHGKDSTKYAIRHS
jgi:hypothetical protein